jgi:hypothetical protein
MIVKNVRAGWPNVEAVGWPNDGVDPNVDVGCPNPVDGAG